MIILIPTILTLTKSIELREGAILAYLEFDRLANFIDETLTCDSDAVEKVGGSSILVFNSERESKCTIEDSSGYLYSFTVSQDKIVHNVLHVNEVCMSFDITIHLMILGLIVLRCIWSLSSEWFRVSGRSLAGGRSEELYSTIHVGFKDYRLPVLRKKNLDEPLTESEMSDITKDVQVSYVLEIDNC